MENNIKIGDKEYSRDELLEFGKQHYPKFYWIYRGLGLVFMFIGVLTALIFVAMILITNAEMKAIADSFDRDVQNEFPTMAYYITLIPFAIMAMVGAVLFGISFKKKPDDAYIKHAIDYYTKLDANNRAREARIKARDERVTQKQENNDISQLLKYKELLNAGVITQEEFDQFKKKLLGL